MVYKSFWGKHLDFGDTVIVPRQYERTAWLREVKDISAIIDSLGIAARVLVTAALKF